MAWQVKRRREINAGFWWVKLRERDHLEDPGLENRTILK
jgi:hypothetical protein